MIVSSLYLTISNLLLFHFTGFSQGIGEGMVASKAVEAIGRNPDATPQIKSNMIMGIALTETTGIYGLLISILLLFLVVL